MKKLVLSLFDYTGHMVEEAWLPIACAPRYETSNAGRIRSLDGSIVVGGEKRRVKGRILKATLDRYGYEYVNLGGGSRRTVHSIVAEAFHGPKPSPLHQVNHKNGVRSDNRPENLEWVTVSENIRHAFRVLGREHPRPALGKFGSEHNRSMKVVATSPGGDTIVFGGMQEAGRAGFDPSKISLCVNGKRKRHKGYAWRAA
jgi:hypothetical protein